MDQEHYDYIWKNFRLLLEPSTGYTKYMRAALFPVNESWPDAEEVRVLKAQHSTEFLTEKFQEIERGKNQYIDAIFEQIRDQIYFNYCPGCRSLAISPKSERCVKCKHEWYGTNEYRKNS